MRIKICGMTRIDDVRAAAAFGVDAIGVVMVPNSRRAVTVEQAQALCRATPPLVTRVGLFMDAPADEVRAVLDQAGFDMLQFHGHETADYCASFGRPWIKAIPLAGVDDLHLKQQLNCYAGADALLLDGHAPGEMGGSGSVIEIEQLPTLPRPWLLAGGLQADNVVALCQRWRPQAVDVSSGVEITPGIKDHTEMKRFIDAVKQLEYGE
jgi:phosphoribosylanthranilate isomerase